MSENFWKRWGDVYLANLSHVDFLWFKLDSSYFFNELNILKIIVYHYANSTFTCSCSSTSPMDIWLNLLRRLNLDYKINIWDIKPSCSHICCYEDLNSVSSEQSKRLLSWRLFHVSINDHTSVSNALKSSNDIWLDFSLGKNDAFWIDVVWHILFKESCKYLLNLTSSCLNCNMFYILCWHVLEIFSQIKKLILP